MDKKTKIETLPCNRVFNIPELLALVVLQLENSGHDDSINDVDSNSSRSLRVLVNVCHLWHSLFAPYAWKNVTLSGPTSHNQRRRLSGFKHYGAHIQTLTCHIATKSTLKTISRRQNLTNLHTLHLTLDRKSIWVTYNLLEKSLLCIQERLSTVSIKFDAAVLNTRLLWSLSQLPFLEHLTLDTDRYNYSTHGQEGSGCDLCRDILRCCTRLRSLKMDYGYTYKEYVPALVRFRTAVLGKVARRFERFPTSPEDAIGRRRVDGRYETDSTTSKKQNFSSNRTQDQQHEQQLAPGDMPLILMADYNSGHSLSGGSKLRRLQLRQCSLDTNVFSNVVKQTLQLEELDLQALLYRGSSDILRIISQHCHHLRILRLSGHNEGMSIMALAKLLWGLPSLETLFMSLNNSEALPWQSLDTHLTEFEPLQQEQIHSGHHQHHRRQKRHPLKTLSIKGYHKETLSTLLEILSIQSLAIETLTVGSPWFFQVFVEHTPGNIYSPFAPLVDRQTPSRQIFSRTWSTLKDSLTHLDMSTTILVDRDVAARFFGRLQELVNLKGLYVSARHVQDWFPKDFFVGLPPSPLNPGPMDDDNSVDNSTDNNSDGSNVHQIVEDINRNLPTGNFSFPSLRDVIVRGEDRNVPVPFELTVSEAVFVIIVAPCLEYLYLKAGSVSEATLRTLKRMFPDRLRAIPKERLLWIDERVE